MACGSWYRVGKPSLSTPRITGLTRGMAGAGPGFLSNPASSRSSPNAAIMSNPGVNETSNHDTRQ